MIKKALAAAALGAALFGSQVIGADSAEAADVWVYTDDSTGRSVYVDDDDFIVGNNRQSICAEATAKWVNDDGSLYEQTHWKFFIDTAEGFLWAVTESERLQLGVMTQKGAVWREGLDYRPDLVALYDWIQSHQATIRRR